MFLMQYLDEANNVRAGLVEKDTIYTLKKHLDFYQLMCLALNTKMPLSAVLTDLISSKTLKFSDLMERQKISLPVTHPNLSEIIVSGVALTHKKTLAMCDSWYEETDSKSEAEKILCSLRSEEDGQSIVGPRPVWFFKGFGAQLRTTGQNLAVPEDALDMGEEAELVAIYIIDPSGQPRRVGFALGNDHSDHLLEKVNYYYLAQSKLRQCSIGPEIFIGDLPKSVSGNVVIRRNGDILWESCFSLGADAMLFSLDTIEHHIFKHAHFCQPGAVHLVFLGADNVSCSDKVSLAPGDSVAISADLFPHSLVNTFAIDKRHRFSRITSL